MNQQPSNQFASVHIKLKRLVSTLVTLWLASVSHSVYAETRVSADVSTNTESSENPFLLTGSDTQSLAVSASIAPSVVINNGTTEFRINGKIGYTDYLRRYDSTDNYGINGTVSQRLSPRLSYTAGLSFDSAVIGAGDLQTVRGTNPAIAVPPPSVPGDIALSGLRSRRTSVAGNINTSFQATARDSWQIGGNFSFSRFPRGLVDVALDQSGVSIGYNKSLSDRTSIGLSGSVSRVDFQNARVGDSITASPQVTFSTQLGLRWSLSGSVGGSYTSSKGVTGTFKQASLSGSANICRSGDRNQLCAFLSRAIEPTIGGSVRPQTSIGGSYRLQVSEKDSIAADAGFTRASGGGVSFQQAVEFARASVGYSRKFTDRFAGRVSAAYNDSFRDVVQRRANVSVAIGLTYRLGDRR